MVKGLMTPEKEEQYKSALDDALEKGYAILQKGGSAIDAVEISVITLENSPLFNAGWIKVTTCFWLEKVRCVLQRV